MNKNRIIRLFARWARLLTLGLWMAAGMAIVAGAEIESQGIVSGADSSSGSRFSVKGAIGHPFASQGEMRGERFGVAGGAIGLLTVVQMPGAPALSIAVGGGGATISWSMNVAGWILQESGSLGARADWRDTTGVSGNQITVTVPVSGGRRFYRLRRP